MQGWKNVRINTQERAVSVDINRLQKFAGADHAELLRYWFDVQGNDDLDGGAVVSEFSALGTPLRGEIVNGLMVRPQSGVGVLDLFVDPGVLLAIQPDSPADPDNSNYKFCHEPGISTLGALLMTVGAVATRIDVIEVQLADEIAETDNRDIFNTATGLFSATSVTKATRARAASVALSTVRVRAGAPGGGFPGTAAGWLPICVVKVPLTATKNDDMTFWDVRPLLNDRVRSPFNLTQNRPRVLQQRTYATQAFGTRLVTGIVDAESIDGRRLGGRLRSGNTQATPDADFVAASDAGNQAAGFAPVVGRCWYLYLATPFGLPRWSRYTAAAPRLPRAPRGFPIVSEIGPFEDGSPSAALALPTNSGLGSSTSNAVCVGAGWVSAGPALQGYHSLNDEHYLDQLGGGITGSPIEVGTTSNTNAAGFQTWTIDLVANTHYPGSAKEILVEFRNDLTIAAGGSNMIHEIQIKENGATGNILHDWRISEGQANLAVNPYRTIFRMWVPVSTLYPTLGAGPVEIVIVSGNGFISAGANGFARVLGWKL